MTASDVLAQCRTLRGKWLTRNKKFKEWYDVLKLKNVLEQEGMESVTSNDPRTGYNLARHLLVSSIIAHKIEQEELSPNEVAGTSYLETYVTKRWLEHENRYRQMGKQGWLWHLISWMMATGWYSVFSIVEDDKIWSEVWSPAETFPSFGDDGQNEVAHIYPMSAASANRKITLMGWQTPKVVTTTTLYDWWFFDDDGDVANAIVLGAELVKPPVKDPYLSKVGHLPVFIGPVGGLPDMGSVDVGKWQEHFGESIIATNEELAKNYNRMLTFSQQLMRDTANPRWLELSSGESPILTPENLFKRGAIFRGTPGENVIPLPTPPVPVEIRTLLFDYQNMLQRGLFPAAVFGNVQQQMSYLALANIASASMQTLVPYIRAMGGLLSDLDNYWMDMIRENGFRPHKLKMPEHLPKEFKFDVQADVEIPGYLVQRATVARMLDPEFRLSTSTVMDRLFPEIRNTLREQGNVRKDMALNHPKAILADAIIAYKEQARELREAKDVEIAEVYEKLAASLEAELTGTPTEQGREAIQRAVIPREVLPEREFTEVEGGEGAER